MLAPRTITVAGLLTIVGLLLLTSSKLWLSSAVAQSPTEVPTKAPSIIPAAKGDHCVADTELMRKNHMDMLDHQRDETVIEGVRGNPFSIVGCVDCHAQRDADNKPVRIDAEGQFCESCHAFAAVKIDCFSCHAAVPDETTELIGHHEIHPYLDSELARAKQSMISASSYATRELQSLALHLSDHHE